MQEEILKLLKKFEDVGFYAASLDGKKTIKFNEHKKYFTASTSKIFTAIALYHKLEKESKKDTLLLDFKEKDKVGGSGILQHMYPAKFSLHNLFILMLTISDNTASDLLVNYVTKNHQTKVIELLKLKDTFLRQTNREVVNGEFDLPPNATHKEWESENKKRKNTSPKNSVSLNLSKGNISTPHDFYLVLHELMKPRLISEESANKIISTMRFCQRSNFFGDFGYEVAIAHKTGGIPTVRVDVGIVFAKNPFYFIMMAKEIKSLDRAMEHGKKISNLTLLYFNQ